MGKGNVRATTKFKEGKTMTDTFKLYACRLMLLALETPQEKANERYKAESIKPMYAFIIICIAFLITAILQNI